MDVGRDAVQDVWSIFRGYRETRDHLVLLHRLRALLDRHLTRV